MPTNDLPRGLAELMAELFPAGEPSDPYAWQEQLRPRTAAEEIMAEIIHAVYQTGEEGRIPGAPRFLVAAYHLLREAGTGTAEPLVWQLMPEKFWNAGTWQARYQLPNEKTLVLWVIPDESKWFGRIDLHDELYPEPLTPDIPGDSADALKNLLLRRLQLLRRAPGTGEAE